MVAVTRHSSLIVLRKSLELKEQLAYYPSWKKWSVCSTLTKGRAIAIAQPWEDLKKLLMEKYCPGNAIKELKEEFWNHVMIGANVDKYVVPTGRVIATVSIKVPTGRYIVPAGYIVPTGLKDLSRAETYKWYQSLERVSVEE
ncbi:hypothetical protein Tco_0801807 [Tanacetum coccineum]|uniref:Uncharacterized protein n=1 Tax=Tanacetum coccineum TaxID=301880 RepID=A0ABQ4ZX21_9ASTR